MWPRLPLVIVIPLAAIVLVFLYLTYRLVDPLPPRHLAIAAGMAGSGYDNFARRYARILARDGVGLEVRNAAGAVENLNLLRDGASGVQAALTAWGVRRSNISFFTGTPRPLRNLRNSGASACLLALREQLCVHLFSRS